MGSVLNRLLEAEPYVSPREMRAFREIRGRNRAQARRERREERRGQANDPDFEKKHPRGPGGKWIQKGATGAPVEAVQKELGLQPTGTFDEQTRRAVIRFQRMNGLQVDGIVGAQTAGLMMDRPGVAPGALSSEQRQWLRRRSREARIGIPLSQRR